MKKILCFSSIAFLVIVIILIILWTNYVYCSESLRFLITTILTVLGFFIQVVIIIWGFQLGLEFTNKENIKRRDNMTKKMEYVGNSLTSGENKCHIRIENRSDYLINNCKGFITVNNSKDDIIHPSNIKTNGYVFISTNNPKQILQEKISWAIKDNNLHNPHSIDLCAGDVQDIMIFNIASKECIEIPSENGYSTDNGNSRCFLKNKDYEFHVKLVSNDTKSRTFVFDYNCKNRTLNLKND